MDKIIKYKELSSFYTPEKCYITELINMETIPSFSIAEARVAPGVITEIHKLKDTDEVYYILSGKGEMEVGGKLYGIMEEKDIVFIPMNSTQRIRNIGEADLTFLCICSPRFEVKNYE